MTDIRYRLAMHERLLPRADSPWKGGIISDVQLYSVEDAARLASKHAGEEISPRDVLTAAGDGLIQMHTFVNRQARIKAVRAGDVLIGNSHGLPPGTVPKGAGVPLPISACRALANAGRASWRAIEGYENRPEFGNAGCWFDRWVLEDEEPDFETLLSECRVTGYCIKALADQYLQDAGTQADQTAKAKGINRWTPEFKKEVSAYREKHGTAETAKHFNVSQQLIRRHLPREQEKSKGYSAFTHRIK